MKRDLQLELDSAALPTPAGARRQWRRALPLLGFALLWVLALYASTGASMLDIWTRSETFTHGYLVPVIVGWLVWRRRSELAAMAPRPAWWALAPLAAAGFMWLLGELAAVNALSQFALMALLVSTAVVLLGDGISRKLAFPLLFLFFAVPIGEFIMPQLMVWTADFTVAALRLSGVPVYREGQHLVIPTGVWSVVEACSGLRYLIASMMIGTLFAYLMYRSLSRRLMFVAVSIVVPIVANWLRAYMIVMLGHVSGNKLAVGVDHFIYGWVFFGLVIGCMFWIGARWREDHLVVAPSRPSMLPASPASSTSRGLWVAAASLAVIAGVWKIGYLAIERSDASDRPHIAVPAAPGEWQPSLDAVAKWRPYFQEPSSEVLQTYALGTQRVGLVVAYYRNQDYGSKLVSSENTLAKTSDLFWHLTGAGPRTIEVNGKPLSVRASELRGPGGQQLVVWQWYWINGNMTASDYWAKGYTALSRLRGQGDDSAAVLVYTLKNGPGSAEKTLQAFLHDASPAIERALKQTRDTR